MAAAEENWSTTRVDPVAAVGMGWRVFRTRYPAMLKAWALPALVALVGNLALRAYVGSLGLQGEALEGWALGEELPLTFEQQMQILGVGLPLALVAFVASLVGWGLVGRVVVREVLPGREQAPIPWGPLFALGASLMLLYSVGMMLFVIPFLIFFHWFLYAPAVTGSTGGSVGEALEESRRFARERKTLGFTALVVFLWLGLFFAQTLVVAGLAPLLMLVGLGQGLAMDIAGPLANWLLMPLLPALPAAYWALAQKQEEAAPTATPVDAQPERAAERFRTVKCPQCGTLVPYTATGNPVDVTCPVCGRAGRVL